ncbi:AAA family ATPase [Candidatus Woesearchaeota archaeon]|nr:AAA family ATPase [Candidatus Woesearchaeota archaeon]
MPTRSTQKPITVTLDKERKSQLDDLVEFWSMNEKKFILHSLKKYSPSAIKPTETTKQKVREFFWSKGKKVEKKEPSQLTNRELFTSVAARYKLTGERDSGKALHKIFNNEITKDDQRYLLHVLKQETDDVYVPPGLIEEFRVCHQRHHQQLLLEEGAPKAPFYLVVGPTGSGKTKTINRAIELALFDQGIELKQKVADDLEDILEKHPVMARLDLASVAPEIAERVEKEKRREKLLKRSKWPIIGSRYKEETAEVMEEDHQEFGMDIDMNQVNPNTVQTMWYGETGNKMMESFGSKHTPSIRILEEAHALLRVHESHSAQVQEDTLVSTFNIIMDEIEKGERNCMVVALTRRGEEFHQDIYRRFQEKGKIIDMGDYWKDPATIEELINIEAIQQDIPLPTDDERQEIADKVLQIFEHRDLDVTPAYVRKLLSCIVDMKDELKPEYLDDGVLVREAFVNVARNLYPEMFKKTYNRMTRDVKWEDYVGDIKEEFQQLANKCLIHNLSATKGLVLAGPPGTGKTFLARAYLSRNRDISDVTLKMEDLQDEKDPIDGPVKKLAQAFDIAKMCSPTLLFVDEGEAVAMQRQGNLGDRITNKFLNAVDGESELKGVFTVLTTNKPEHLADAATRSKRLKVMPITGKLNERDIYQMLDNYTRNEELAEDLSAKKIYTVAQQICSTPADYSEFFENLVNFKNEERVLIQYAARLTEDKEIKDFFTSNYNATLGIIESLGFSKEFSKEAQKEFSFLIENQQEIITKIKDSELADHYPLTAAHLERTREDRIKSPKIKDKVTLDDYMESQLSIEPQVGYVIGAGADDTSGVVVPISSSFIYGADYREDKIVITGAVNVDSPAAANLNAAVEMMKQSAKEALALVLNYLSSLIPEKDVKRIVGTYLNDRHLHHQFLTAHYMGGGPSAGMALAINTLSVILDLPVRNDFGITGAPWSRGKTKKDVGSAVIIGGTHHKANIVLSYLNRMYVPVQNLKDVDFLTLEGYWQKGKDVVGYENFPSIAGEIYCLDSPIEEQVQQLFEKRIEAKRQDLAGKPDAPQLLQGVENLRREIRTQAEIAIRQRVDCIEKYLLDQKQDTFASLENIFEEYQK